MKTSVITKEYEELHNAIHLLQKEWKNEVNRDSLFVKLDQAALHAGVPLTALTSFDFNIPLFERWISELLSVISLNNKSLFGRLTTLNSIMNEEIASRWMEEALTFNSLYFTQFAKENHIDSWLPQFLAEMAVRPYLQVLAEKVQNKIDSAVPGAGCPVCGEPARLARLEGDGKKVLHCPRCHFHWEANRLCCSSCGNENHETIKFLTIEDDFTSQIQVCEECHGYTKVIDTRQYLERPAASMLDLKTIHLDVIAQENGYKAAGKKNK